MKESDERRAIIERVLSDSLAMLDLLDGEPHGLALEVLKQLGAPMPMK